MGPKRWPAAYAYRTGHTTVGGATRALDMARDSYHSIVDVSAADFSGVWSVPHANLARGKVGSPREAARSSAQPPHNVLRAPRADPATYGAPTARTTLTNCFLSEFENYGPVGMLSICWVV